MLLDPYQFSTVQIILLELWEVYFSVNLSKRTSKKGVPYARVYRTRVPCPQLFLQSFTKGKPGITSECTL